MTAARLCLARTFTHTRTTDLEGITLSLFCFVGFGLMCGLTLSRFDTSPAHGALLFCFVYFVRLVSGSHVA